MSRKIAFVKILHSEDYDYESQYVRDVILNSNVEWEEVTDEEYDLLMSYRHAVRGEQIVFLEQNEALKEQAIKSVKDILAIAKKRQEELNKIKEKKAAAARERKLKKLAKDRAEREKLYNELKQEFEE